MPACVCAFSINKGRSEQTVSSKTPKHQKCVCVCVHQVLTLMIEEIFISILLSERICVCVFVWRVCVRLHKHGVRVMRCSLHPSVLLAFTSSEGDNRGEIERVGEGRRTEINGWLKRFYDSVFLSVKRAASLSRVTCGGSRPDLIYRTCLRVPECLWEDVWEWSCSVSSCGCGLRASVSFFFFRGPFERQRELSLFCASLSAVSAERPALFPPSAMWPGCDTARPRLCR